MARSLAELNALRNPPRLCPLCGLPAVEDRCECCPDALWLVCHPCELLVACLVDDPRWTIPTQVHDFERFDDDHGPIELRTANDPGTDTPEAALGDPMLNHRSPCPPR